VYGGRIRQGHDLSEGLRRHIIRIMAAPEAGAQPDQKPAMMVAKQLPQYAVARGEMLNVERVEWHKDES
jgi:hypothetical protein